jgi:ribosomal protein L34E
MMKFFTENWKDLSNKVIEKSIQYWWAVSAGLIGLIVILVEAKSIWHWLSASGNYNNALVLFLGIATTILAIVITRYALRVVRDDSPKWLNYRADNFHGAHWEWKYKETYEDIDDLHASCLECKHDLKIADGEYPEKILECPSCKKVISRFFGSYDNYQQTIRNLIKQKVRNKYL